MHLIQSILVYPPGSYPPDVDDRDLDPSSNFEVYDFQVSDRPPIVGEQRLYPEGSWVVAAVESYYPSTPSEITACHVAVCTIEGSLPDRQTWADADPFILYIRVKDGAIVEEAAGLADWGIASSLRGIPQPHQLFQPVSDRPMASYNLIAVCA
ncbi:hypothetical protein ACN4EK_24385 [Pantanalinema rosaneae CENA516]|uniref:hypothetical protein n=1 Tax=Pantanalinema rosaneae TaxID=1620701 RepID=UPI003D6F9C46